MIRQTSIPNNLKIQGKFYPLQHEEWLKACRELKPAEMSVLYYLKTLNPCGERIIVSYTDIAFELKLNKSTVSGAIQGLNEKNWLPEWFKFQFRELNQVETGIRVDAKRLV